MTRRLEVPLTKKGKKVWEKQINSELPIQVEMVRKKLDIKFRGEVKARDTHLEVVQA